ncbi:DUF6760 family protein [Anthocerotibacter panamensis]|uniref:DUF6760 family protein n=1 Tax=Anthocerotibacter panamensis TaxID=2857077 RepID=UPI001C404073|nr:DUF6760 family protein [Anthocerotibacter panamensis]
MSYPSNRLKEEVAYLAFHFHWPLSDILDLEHRDRQHWVEQINRINAKVRQS